MVSHRRPWCSRFALTARPVDWDRYARDYDHLATWNPAYQELLDDFEREVLDWHLAPHDVIADLGAGTGNFSVRAAQLLPDVNVIHVDQSREMNAAAQRKANRERLRRFEVRRAELQSCSFVPGSLAAVVCVHALYAVSQPDVLLKRMHQWLRPGGMAYLADIGRSLPVRTWAAYLFRHHLARRGWLPTVALMGRWWSVAIQNRRIARTRATGTFWQHSHEEFRRAVEAAGFVVLRAHIAYNGITDVVVARKP